jgi:hypothetical protein
MVVHGIGADRQAVADLPGRQPPHYQAQYGLLPGGQAVGAREDRDHRFAPGGLHDDGDLVRVEVRRGVDGHPAKFGRQMQ